MIDNLERYADKIRIILKSNQSEAEQQLALCGCVEEILSDKSFIKQYLPDRAEGAHPREVLFEDADNGFCICGHVYSGEAISEPHDHGPSWAIYGQAEGSTTMTDWDIVKPGDGTNPILVEPRTTYVMKPGDAHFYAIGDIHSPHRDQPVKLIRIEGENLDRIERSNIAKA
ncbi:MAG: hypothetical protein ACI8P9_001643 [Parasphingorhabdus sp.]|jgi:hypothetical protein